MVPSTAVASDPSLPVDGRPPDEVVGVWILVAADTMFFLALFASYVVLRFSSPLWPDAGSILSVGRGAVETALIVATAVSFALAPRLDGVKARGALIAGKVFALGFIALSGIEAATLVDSGEGVGSSLFASAFHLITGAIIVHAIAGFVVSSWLLMRSILGQVRRSVLSAMAVYWCFVAAVWVVFFVVVRVW